MKILFTLTVVLIALLVAKAEIGSQIIIDGRGTNSVSRGTITFSVVNTISQGSDMLATGNTNIAYLASNSVATVSARQLLAVVGNTTTGANTNVYYFNRSHNGRHWFAWTNFTIISAGGTNQRQTAELNTLGDYAYVQLYNISNISTGPTGASRSNYVSLHWK